jgi:prophage regulatory protein
MAEVILRLPAVKVKTGLSRSAIYQQADGSFPSPVPLGTRTVGWVESEVEAWISCKIKEREGR